jgi:cell division protein ZapA
MADMSPDSGIQVSIFGQDYCIKGGDDPEHTRELAALVDEKMNFISRQVRVPDQFRIAVLTALHLADEQDALLQKHEELQKEVTAKADHLRELLERIDEAAEEPAAVFPAAD